MVSKMVGASLLLSGVPTVVLGTAALASAISSFAFYNSSPRSIFDGQD